MTFQVTQLDNGLRIASEAQANCHSAAFAIAVDVGARHEEITEGGLSHLLEHMAFKGSTRMNAKQIAEQFDLMGGNVNAYTSHEHTVYYAKVLREYADDACKLLCDIVSDFAFDQQELEREREVILQEMAMHQDSPDDVVFDLFQETAFGNNQPLGRSILGLPERVSAFTRENLIAYTAKHYQPKRMVIAAAGQVNHQTVVDIATAHFGKLARGVETPGPVRGLYVGGEKTQEKELEQVQLVVGYPGVAIDHLDYFSLQMFSTILGGGMSSRLFQEIREKRGLAYSVSCFSTGYQDAGVLGIYAGTTVEHLAELTGALKEVVGASLADISEAEMLRAKNQLKAGVVMSRENCGAIAEWIARHLLVYGRYKTAEEIVEMLDAVTIGDVQRSAGACFKAATPTVVALGPEGSVNNARLGEKLAA
jgi:predicted Zn-dependent peptidase